MDRRQAEKEARLHQLNRQASMRPASLDGRPVLADESQPVDILRTIEEAAEKLAARKARGLRMYFDDTKEKTLIENPKKGFDSAVNGWNATVAPACAGIRAVNDYIADFCQSVSAFTEQYALMLNANNQTMVLRCDPRGQPGSIFEIQDKYRHCMANCEAASVGRGGLLVAATISVFREATDLVTKPVVNTFDDRAAQLARHGAPSMRSLMGDYARNLKQEAEGSYGDMRANWEGVVGGAKGLRCADACAGYRPFYIRPKP